MKNQLFFLIFSITQFFSAQLPDISFNGTNAWTKTPSNYSGITYDTANNQATIVGNGSSYVRTTLSSTFTVPSTVYFSAEVWIENANFNVNNIKNPTLIVRDNNDAIIYRFNMDWGLQNSWYQAGIRIDNYSGNTLKFEFGMNNVNGTMKVKNPILSTTAPAFTYEFPWTIPANKTTTLNIDTNQKHNFENDLLSSNTHFVFAKVPWSSSLVQDPINNYFPMSNLRFPGGTVGNYYNYTTDNFYNDPLTPSNLINFNNQGNKLDYNGYKSFTNSSGASSTYMLNVMLGNAQTAIDEYKNRYDGGLPIKWVELGNEMYLSENQNASNVSSVSSYISHTKTITTGIKNHNTNAKVAVCLEKDDFAVGSWNYTLSQNQNYFDAATLHNYIPIEHYFYSKYSSYAMLRTYKASMERFNAYKALFPDKPLLLTEWGITGNLNEPYFLNALSFGEVFLAIEKANEQNIVKQSGIHMLYKNNNNEYQTMFFYDANNKLRVTTVGRVFAKLFEVFKNAEVFNADSQSAELETGVKAVNAKMVKNGNVYKIFAINKLPNASPLEITINGVPYNGTYNIETYAKNMSAVVADVAASSTNNWGTTTGSGSINLPASSISVVTLTDSSLSTIENNPTDFFKIYPNPTSNLLCVSSDSKHLNKIPYQIYDTTGKLILNNFLINGCINVEKLLPGTYILKLLLNDKDHKDLKFIKK